MKTNEIIGYRVLRPHTEEFVDVNQVGDNFLYASEPMPISRGDAFRRLAGFLDQHPEVDEDEFTVEPVYREYTPMETASQELGSMLESLCKRHGLDLGLSRAQMERQIAKELVELGAKAR